ncbi:hypothetical protein [Aliarcobacter skirrowii]|uniref:Uncharacterized protein n=1 Tax=Aliarcobacter skirrowii CCUG 10374 TaxID=1032239 RepID=A0AAD0WNW0_9BACT|nr:hypothetical protein [Aliarcobacter skirrowii]AXX85318.1 hypothetical protein ASKIR_1527 [Aliarcobacter skirrowii CCUG 10374]KAB0620148.1 hypothetical protein F7P70_08905 [Aliarcobacter skirrowii CCUG 10374]RXI25216.1 hypothetical protein CP959_08940 [Aliarcobacter skirrowii CCUG 10374]SUU96148.1 Uncharacterised protein [Aliarcobacter skirrowii]
MKNIILSIFLIVQNLNAYLNINVGNNTHLKGSLLASDSDNLNLTTNTLTFANSSNSSYSSSKSIGGSVSSSVNGDVSSVGYNSENSLETEASKTLATLGNGNITIKDIENSDDLTKLNQDVNAINKDLYSSSTGTKVDATLDTRLLTEDGRKEIAEDVERSKRLGQAVADVVSSDSLNIKDTFDHIGDVQKDLDVQKALALNDNGQTINILENQQNYSQEQIDKAINDYAQIYASTYGVNIEEAKMAVLNDKYGSTYTNKDNTNSNIYLDKTNNQNALSSSNTLGHEVAHVRQNQGQTYLRETTQLQEEYSDLFGKYSSSGLDFSSNTYNYVKLDINKTNGLNSYGDINVLNINTKQYLQDVSRVNSGDGRIDDLSYDEAKDMIKNVKGMVIYKKPDEIGGYMVGTPEQAMNYLMTGKTEEEKNKLFVNRIQRDIGKGFVGLGNSLNELYNLDTSKMTPQQRLMFDYLNLKVVTVPAYGGSKNNPVNQSSNIIINEINKVGEKNE